MLTLLAVCSSGHCASTNMDTKGVSKTQVDGITSAVVDNLWSRTDYWWHRGEYPRIIALDRVMTEADPHFVEPYSTGGWLMESMGNNAEAEKYYRLGTTRNPLSSYMWFNLGFFYFNTLKDYPDAVTAFHSAANAPDGGFNDWKMLAHSYEKNNQPQEALAVWKKLHDKYPADAVVLHNLDEIQHVIDAMPAATGP